MKVKVSVTVDIDPVSWAANYGVEGAPEIRADVKTYVDNLVSEQLRENGLLIEG